MTKYLLNEKIKTDCLIIPVFEDKELDKQTKIHDENYSGIIFEVLESKDFEGKKMQTSLLYTKDKNQPRILLIGLGKEKDLNIKKYKEVVGASVILLQGKKMKKLSFYIPELIVNKFDLDLAVKETAVSIEVAAYAYDEYKSKDDKVEELKTINFIIENKSAKTKKALEEGLIIAEGINFARVLGNTPPTIMTPTSLAGSAKKMALKNKNLKCKILSKPEIEKLNMGCLLGVARGSEEEPKFIIVEYWGEDKNKKPSVLVGKGITFDSGGLSLKPGDYMTDMKFDMLGAATVLGIIKVVADLKLKKNIIALVPAAENMPSGIAYRPDDILTAMNGKTVEIKNTDAEGRLILADALCYAKKYDPKEVIDLATLTGACMAALGLEKSGLFSVDDKMVEKLSLASETVGESLWRLPLGEEYSEAVKSEVADVKNTGGVGGERYGTASTAAAFLQFFTDYPWTHIDLASAIYSNKGKSWIRAGANGFGVQTIVEYLRK